MPRIDQSFDSVRVLVIGLGRFGGGVGVTRWLARQGARVTVTDQSVEADLRDSMAEVGGMGVEFHLGRHDEADLDACDLVVVNPAVDKRRSGFFQEIQRRGLPWTTELNLFCERCPARVIGVTGSFGKSTVCAMIAAGIEAGNRKVSRRCGRVHLGGNIGISLLDSLAEMTADDDVVLELSSAQLEDAPRIGWAPQVAAITNIQPHHLDRHGGYEAYIAAKLNIARRPRRAGPAPGRDDRPPLVLGPVDEVARSMLERQLREEPRQVIPVPELPPDFRVKAPGEHNRTNAAFALAVISAAGATEAAASDAIANFPGLPHRLERVSASAGVTWINDSKSTAPSATVTALRALDGCPVVAIVGGQRKEGVPYDPMVRELVDRCRAVICFGEAGPAMAAAIAVAAASPAKQPLTVRVAARVEDALQAAVGVVEPGDYVLFSPGTPSFDAFHNYTERGRRFVELVRALPEAEPWKPT